MKPYTTLAQCAADVVADIERIGFHEALGLERVPDNRPCDPQKCMCGAGCESRLECYFWYWVRKTHAMERKARRQVRIGKFRVDSLFDCDGQRVVVELDGKAFHQDKRKDHDRDKVLLQSVDAVIRIPYAAMTFYEHATFCVLASWYPRFQLRAVDNFCLSLHEFNRELRLAQENYDASGYLPVRQWVEDVEPLYELWSAHESGGWVGSPKAYLHQQNVTPIYRYRRRVGKPSRIIE